MNDFDNEILPTDPDEGEEITERVAGRETYEWVRSLVGAVLVITLLFTFVVRLMGVDGHSMVPTLQDGDRLIVVSGWLCGDYKYGDIVIAYKESFDAEPIVKRVIATEGQTVDIDGAFGRIVDFSLDISGAHIADMRGDGLVVATATGSTAYALSAGGPLVAPGFGGLVTVPLAPHTLHSRAIVTAENDVVEMGLAPTAADREAAVFVDGELLQEDYVNDLTYLDEGTQFPLTLGEGELFLMGDNRNRSSDSRDERLGAVDERLIIGKAVLLVFPGRDSLTDKRDFSRLGSLKMK